LAILSEKLKLESTLPNEKKQYDDDSDKSKEQAGRKKEGQRERYRQTMILVSIPCDAILAKYGRTRAFSLCRPLSLRHLSLLQMPARERCLLVQQRDCIIALESQDECIAQSLHFIQDIFQSVFLDAFCVIVFLQNKRVASEEVVVSDYGSTLRAACENAETHIFETLKKLPELNANKSHLFVQITCNLHLRGATCTVDDMRDFFRKQTLYRESENVPNVLLEPPTTAKIHCTLRYYDSLGSLFHQAYPVFKKHVQWVVRRDIRKLLDLVVV